MAQQAAPAAERASLTTTTAIPRPASRAGTSSSLPAATNEVTLDNVSVDKLNASDARNLLQKHLGKDKYDQYWVLLRKFLQSRLSKPEFDSSLRRLLVSKELSTFLISNRC